MKNSTYLFCNDVPWQATIACLVMSYRDEMLAARQIPEIISDTTTPKKFTEEAIYMIYVILTFVGLAIFGSSITAYEFFIKDNEKEFESAQKGFNRRTAKPTQTVLKQKMSKARNDFFEDFRSFLMCFCFVKNGKKILNTSSNEAQIGCFQGLRILGNAWIIAFHIALLGISALRNVEETKPFLDYRITQLVLNGACTVDIFFVISGFLNAKAFFQKYSINNGDISWFYFYLRRFLRLTPAYMVVLGFNATLFAFTGKGIIWPTYETNPASQNDWWWHLLYINNFEEVYQQSMGWSWSLAADMQFYIISPLFMVPLIRWPRLGYALIVTCITCSCITSFLLTYQYNLIDGISRSEFYLHDLRTLRIKFNEYFDSIYSKPYTRISPYLVAILLAYYLHKKNFNKETQGNNSINLCSGWIVTILCMWYCFFFLFKREETLISTALYNGTKHQLFSCGLAWIIYLCLTGQSEFLNKCLSWKYFLPLSRLSYCAYLIHPLILMRYFLEAEDLVDFSYALMIWIQFYSFVITYAASFIVSILFEIPVLNVLDWFSKKKVKRDSSKTHLD